MSRRRPEEEHRASCAEVALDELCVRFGFCISPSAAEAILANPPADAEAFLDAVVVAEGLSPELMLKEQRRPMLAIVRDWVYDDDRGPGGTSGRARFPERL